MEVDDQAHNENTYSSYLSTYVFVYVVDITIRAGLPTP